MSEKFLENRLKYHTASRVGAKEQDPLLNALNRDQHTVHYKDVWTSPIEDFPVNTGDYKTTTDSTSATDNLISVFKAGATSVDFRNGKIWTNNKYPAVKLYEQVEMSPVTGSNGSGILYQSYEVLDNNNIRLMDWVSPMAVFDPDLDKPVPGYAGKIELNLKNTTTWVEVQKTDKSTATGVQGSVWDASYGNWEFVYSAGMAIFNADYTPTRYASSFTTYGGSGDLANVVKLRWTGFLYTGIYLDTKVANTFAGITLTDIDLDTYDTVGIVRITDSAELTGEKPPISSSTGFLQVMDINHDEDRNADGTLNVKRRIRQIIYPDSEDESTPYSRVGTCETLTGTIDWSEWTQMGGGALRRVVINGTTTPVTVVAVNNVMYESFGANTFTMPDPDTVPVGTRIGFEQFIGTARVSSNDNGTSFVQILEPDVPDGDYDSQPGSTAVSYVFECVLGQNGTKREWMLDVDHNYAAAITAIVSRTEALSKRLTTAETDIDTLEGRATSLESRAGALETRASALEAKDTTHDGQISTLQTRATNLETRASSLETKATNLETKTTNIHGEFVNQIARQTKHVKWATDITALSVTAPSTTQLGDPAQMKTFLANNEYTLYYYDLIVSVMSANQTITLPTSGVPVGAKVTFELYPSYTVTIKDNVNTESFSGDRSNILVLEFEYTYTTASATAWTLLSLA